jgi:hypothetical protein
MTTHKLPEGAAIEQVLHYPTPERAAANISDGPTMDEYLSLPESIRRHGL